MTTAVASRELVASEMDELRRPVLSALALTGLAASGAWIVGLAIVHYTPPPAVTLAAPLALLLGSAACLLLRRLPTTVHVGLLLFGLTASLVLGFLSFPERDWLYCLPLVVVASGTLVAPATSYAIAAVLSVNRRCVPAGHPGLGEPAPFARPHRPAMGGRGCLLPVVAQPVRHAALGPRESEPGLADRR